MRSVGVEIYPFNVKDFEILVFLDFAQTPASPTSPALLKMDGFLSRWSAWSFKGIQQLAVIINILWYLQTRGILAVQCFRKVFWAFKGSVSAAVASRPSVAAQLADFQLHQAPNYLYSVQSPCLPFCI